MNIAIWLIIITTIAGVFGTGLGGAVGALIKRDSSKTVSLFLSFAAGVMLAVVCFDLILDAIKSVSPMGKAGVFIVILGILFGYAVVYALNYLIDKNANKELKHVDSSHPKTADSPEELIHVDHFDMHKDEPVAVGKKKQLFVAGVIMAAAIALHNLPEGMVIGASYAGSAVGDIFNRGGLIIAVVIGLHNIPEGMAVSVPLISGGTKRLKAILITALSGAPTIIGALIGYYIGTLGQYGLCISLSFASGAMTYVVLGELLPEAYLMWKSKMPAFATLTGIITGMIIIYI